MVFPRVLIALLVSLVPLAAMATPAAREAEVGVIAGAAFIRYEDVDEWVPAESSMPVTEGDQLRTDEDGRFEILVRRGAVVRLDEETTVDVLALEAGFIHLFMAAGDLYATLPAGGRAGLELEMPLASLRASTRTAFRLSVSEEGDAAEIAVSRGEVQVDSARGSWKVAAGRSLYLEDGIYAFGSLDPPDDWDLWNRERDRAGWSRPSGDHPR